MRIVLPAFSRPCNAKVPSQGLLVPGVGTVVVVGSSDTAARVGRTALFHAVRPGSDTGTGRRTPGTSFPSSGTAPTPKPR